MARRSKLTSAGILRASAAIASQIERLFIEASEALNHALRRKFLS
jgi:hypothetical protein